MSKTKQFINDTIFFFSKSRQYMAGEKTTIAQWTKAYIRFVKLSRGDNS